MRIGIAGTGFMGTTHAAAWAKTDAKLVAFTAETLQEAEPLASQYCGTAYPDLEAMLQHVDVVDICSPTHLHYRMVSQAATVGKDIICEKPLANTLEQAQEMLAICKAAGVRLLVAHVVRFFPEYALAKSIVDQGQIGQPGILRLTRGSYRPKKSIGNWFLDEKKSGGILLDLMIHDFDYARWIAGNVESVFAKKVTIPHPEATLDYGMAILKHRDGALSHIAGAWAYPPPTFRTGFEIAGDAGLIEFDSDETSPIRNLLIKVTDLDASDVALPSSLLSESPYVTEIKEFYETLCNDRPVRVSAEDGLAAVQIAEAAIKSARTGEAVQLEQNIEVR